VNDGSTQGGTAISITGTNFAVGATVQFGNVLVASSQMQNRAMRTVISPPHAEGSADVLGWAIRASHARIHVSAVGLRANAGELIAAATIMPMPDRGTATDEVVSRPLAGTISPIAPRK